MANGKLVLPRFSFSATMDKIRGAGWIVLNIFRGCNIITLAAICASAWIMIVTAGLPNAFFFFDAASHFFFSCTCVFLIVSETGVFSGYFERNWPVFSYAHSFTWLGVTMIIMGCNTFGSLAQPIRSQEKLGLPMWRLVLASGILAFIFGLLNLIVSFIWRDSQEGITARHIRNDGNLAKGMSSKSSTGSATSSMRSHSVREDKKGNRFTRFFGAGGDKNSDSKFRVTKSIITHPRPPSPGDVDVEAAHGGYGLASSDHSDDRRSPVVPELKRPPTAMHPAFTGGSRYSEASHIGRF